MKAEKDKGFAWRHIDWYSTKKIVLRLQRRIYKARRDGNLSRVHWLQRLLIRNYQAKLYSVFQVTALNLDTEFCKHNRFASTSDEQKLKLAKNLKMDSVCRGLLPTHKKDSIGRTPANFVGISKIRDRAKQMLCRLALEPEWEAVFERHSFAHRPGRSVHDVVEAFFLCMHSNTIKHVCIVEFGGFFERVNQARLLEKLDTFPLIQEEVSLWLKAGILENYSQVVKEPGTVCPKQGLSLTSRTNSLYSLAPFLVNVLLHGLEAYLKECVLEIKSNFHLDAKKQVCTTGTNADHNSLTFIRYGDRFVIVDHDLELLKQLVLHTRDWFLNLGLELPKQGFAIKDARQSFDFLGFQYTQVRKNGRYKVQIIPSRKSQRYLLLQIREIVQTHKSVSSYVLINELRPQIIGWANYYRCCDSAKTFSKIDNLIFQKLRAWVFRRHPRQSRTEIRQKYFPVGQTYKFHTRSYQQDWILTGEFLNASKQKISNFLPKMAWVLSKRHSRLEQANSPFDSNSVYWLERVLDASDWTVRQKQVLKNQSYRCNMCGRGFDFFDTMEIDHGIPQRRGNRDAYFNLQVVHRECRVKKSKSKYKLQS